jgi:hypothetical protein
MQDDYNFTNSFYECLTSTQTQFYLDVIPLINRKKRYARQLKQATQRLQMIHGLHLMLLSRSFDYLDKFYGDVCN